MRTIEQIADSISGPKVDFGCGDWRPIREGFIGIDILPPDRIKQACRDRYIRANIVDSDDKEIEKLTGRVQFAVARHLFSAIPRRLAVPALVNLRKTLAVSGLLLIADMDLTLLWSAIQQGRGAKAMGRFFESWFNANKYDDESWHELLNVGMRGGGDFEIQWRYTRESFAKCLTQAAFKRYEILELDDPRATSFTHSLPGEDMVFLCYNAE